jgi:competence protein ComEC
MAFPILFLAVSFIVGIASSSAFHLSAGPTAAGLAVVLLAAWVLFLLKKTAAAFALTLAAGLLLGAGVFAAFDENFENNGLRKLPRGEYLEFAGLALRTPAAGLERDDLYLQVESIRRNGVDQDVRGRLRVSVTHSGTGAALPEIIAGDRLRISAQINAPADYRNFEEPFSRIYLKTQFLHALASTKSPLLVEKIGTGRLAAPLRWISRIRSRCLRMIEQAFAAPGSPGGISPEGAIFEALILGERARLDAPTILALQKTGLYHLFAISGAHIVLVSSLLFALFRALRLAQRPSYALLLVILVFYGFLVEGRASVVRAVIMAAAFLIGKLLWKDVHLLNTIAVSAGAILLLNPAQLFDAGFQLTFAATLGLILFYPRIRAAFPELPLKISDMIVLSIAAQAAVLPIIAVTFHRVIFSGLILNLIGIPLVGAVMAAGYVFLPIAFLAPFLAGPAAAGLAFLLRVFLASTRLFDGVPFLSYRVPTPPAAVVIAYYAFLLLFLAPPLFKRQRAITAIGFATAFALLITYPFSASVKDLTVTLIDVGQGDAILVEFPGREKMLIDGGGLPTGSFDIGENVVSPFLWSKGIKAIDRLVLTHPHPDHMNGLEAIARNFRIREFWEGRPSADDPKYDNLVRMLGAVPRRRIIRGYKEMIGGAEVFALAPAELAPPRSPDNDDSLVLRISLGDTAFLLTGDIGRTIEADILASGLEARADVLKAPHHGSDSSSSEAFLEAVRPKYILISAGRGNRINLPHPAVLARYEKAGIPVLRTDLQGAVEIQSDGRRLSVRTADR